MTAPPKPPSGQEGFFWKTKTLEEMSGAEMGEPVRRLRAMLPAEAGGRRHRQDLFHSTCPASSLDAGHCSCKDYSHRSERVSDASGSRRRTSAPSIWLPRAAATGWLPRGVISIGGPLISGDPDTVHEAGVSVRGRVEGTEDDIADADLEDHIVRLALPVAQTRASEAAAEGVASLCALPRPRSRVRTGEGVPRPDQPEVSKSRCSSRRGPAICRRDPPMREGRCRSAELSSDYLRGGDSNGSRRAFIK